MEHGLRMQASARVVCSVEAGGDGEVSVTHIKVVGPFCKPEDEPDNRPTCVLFLNCINTIHIALVKGHSLLWKLATACKHVCRSI